MTAKLAMKILALEFSTLRRSVALVEDGALIRENSEEARRGGSPFPLIKAVLEHEEPDALAIGLGPGSYTGIRSALAIAQGWNLAKNIRAAGINSAEAIAFRAWSMNMRGEVEITIDAQRKEIYSVVYSLTEEGVIEVEALEIRQFPRGRGLLVGPDSKTHPIFPSALAVASLAERSQTFVSPETLEAIYLREPSFVKAPAVRHT
jgi:tRNA threonylcarbamoyl adenosine modification protein YeaZ